MTAPINRTAEQKRNECEARGLTLGNMTEAERNATLRNMLIDTLAEADRLSIERNRMATAEIEGLTRPNIYRFLFEYLENHKGWKRCAHGYMTLNQEIVVMHRTGSNGLATVGRNY